MNKQGKRGDMKMKKETLLMNVVLVIGLLLLAITMITSSISSKECKNSCIGALAVEVVPDGNWFSLQDHCVCYYQDSLKTLTLE